MSFYDESFVDIVVIWWARIKMQKPSLVAFKIKTSDVCLDKIIIAYPADFSFGL